MGCSSAKLTLCALSNSSFLLMSFFFLVGEVNELVQGLLVHVTVLLQLLVRLVQFLEQL